MKRNGFTLIEILVVIALLAAVSVTVGVSMTGMTQRDNEKKIKEYQTTIENAACVYAEVKNMTSNTTVTIGTLLDEGYLRKNLTNPSTKNNIEEERTKRVTIKCINNEKKCEFKTR